MRPENARTSSEVAAQIDFREADLLDLKAMRSACQGVDYVLHQAAIPSVPRSIEDPARSNAVNVDGTLNVLIAARDAGVKRVVYAASSSAYGDTPTLPKREDMPANPISPYAVAKLAGELYMTSFYRVYGLPTVSLRYFNIFGPRQDANSQYSAVLAKFITSMLQGEKPTIYGDGEQSRDFTYIDNVVGGEPAGRHATRIAGCRPDVQHRYRPSLQSESDVCHPEGIDRATPMGWNMPRRGRAMSNTRLPTSRVPKPN